MKKFLFSLLMLLAIGLLSILIGAILKIMHYNGSDLFILFGGLLVSIAFLVLFIAGAYHLLIKPKSKSDNI